MLIKCEDCGRYFEPGTQPDGRPNGVGFRLEDGTVYNVCCWCIEKKGGKDDEPSE